MVVSRVRPAVVATGCVGIRSPHFTPVSKGSVALEHGQQIPVDPKMRSGIGRAWWTVVVFDGIESELAWLRETVYEGMWRYLPAGASPVRLVTAFERWRKDPADLALPVLG